MLVGKGDPGDLAIPMKMAAPMTPLEREMPPKMGAMQVQVMEPKRTAEVLETMTTMGVRVLDLKAGAVEEYLIQ